MRAFLPPLKPQKRRARKLHSTVQVRWPLYERTEFKDGKRARGSGGRPWTGGGELLHLPWDPTAGPNVFFIDRRSGILGGATAWLALGVWINCIAVQCDATVKAIAAENINQVVHVDHVRDFHAEFLDECMAKWKITTIVIGGRRAC